MCNKQVIRVGLGVWLLAALLAFGCADPNTPGSDNVESTGTVLRVVSIYAKDGSSSGNNEVDVVIHNCPGGAPEKGLFDVSMDVALKNDSPGAGGQQSTSVTITSYTVEYFSSDSGAVPLPSEKVVTNSFTIAPGSSNTQSGLLLMSIRTKEEFILRGGDPFAQTIYQAKVTFYGVNDFGYVVKAVGSVWLELADWETC